MIEWRSFVVRRPAQLYLMTLGTAVVFAVVQNIVCLSWYYPNSPIELVAWRWTACVALHGLCTFVATRALVRVWERGRREHRPPDLGGICPAVGVAILIHAAYNACVYMRGYLGYGF